MYKSKFTAFLGTAAIAIGLTFVVASCHKKSTTTTTEDTGYTSDQAVSEKSFEDAQSISDQASTVASGHIGFKGTGLTFSACAVVSHSSDTITIDFGTTDCVCLDGRTRRGKIICVYTGAYADSGSTHTIYFENYYQNDNQVTGTKTVTNMGHNALGQPYFNVTVAGSVIRSTGTVSVAWSRVRTWTAGYSTPSTYADDVYSISGSGTITRASGEVVSVNIPTATPLVVAAGCAYIEAGTIVYTLPSGLTRSLNFGNTPACDNNAVLTLPSGATYAITLP